MADKIKLDDSIAIGIDFGTTNTCAYVYIDGRLESLENGEGKRQTPSHVHFSSKKVLVGGHAKKMNACKHGKGFYGPKRFLGRTSSQVKSLVKKMENLSLVKASKKPIISIETENGNMSKTPQDICAIILRKVKQDVEDKLGCEITKAVITVPAYFNTNQRQETLEAAKEAGFTVLKLFNEPNASALNFHYEAGLTDSEHYSLVYDLGGGTFDVSIMKKVQDNLVVVATDGDTQLGGNDFDELVADYVCTELERLYGYNIRQDKRAMNELLSLCEEAKKNLSFMEETVIELRGFIPSEQHVITFTLTRQKFEELIMKMLKKTIDITDRCVHSAKIDITRINDVILAGCSTRIPKVRFLLSKYFNGKNLSKLLNPDESVAKGAALQAAMLSEHPRQQIKEIKILDIVPLSLGCEIWNGEMDKIIRKNTFIPVKRTSVFFNSNDMQKKMEFDIHEGNRLECNRNAFLGKFVIDLTPARPGKSKVYLTMNVDANGILTVTAKNEDIDVVETMKIENYKREIRSDQEINGVIEDVKKDRIANTRLRRLHLRRRDLYFYCEQVIFAIRTNNYHLSDEYQDIVNRCREMQSLSYDLNDLVKIKECMSEIKQTCKPLIEKYEFRIKRR